jgi:hypothetical protein
MSEVNPYINPTCPSSRFCKNHKYNTEGLFSGFYNENSSIHCGQQHIEMPRYQKSIGGAALPGNVYVNLSPGEQLQANNGVEYTDIHTDSSMAGMRTGFVELQKDPSINLTVRSTGDKKEGFFTDYSSRPGGYEPGNMSTSSTAVKPLMTTIMPNSCKSVSEKFCAACASPCGCAVLGVIVAILVIWLLIKCFNCWSKEHTGRKIFTGGSFNSINRRYCTMNDGNMNLLGGAGEEGESSSADEFAII